MATITGDSAANTLVGTDQADTIDGGAGADTMAGGKGNDTYVVDDPGDVVVENVNEGNDTVKTSLLAYTLGANVENLTYTGTGAFYGTGNALANVLSAYTASSTLAGGAGDDVYQVNQTGTTIIEAAGGGHDTVVATANFVLPDNVEVLKLFGLGQNGGFTGVGNSGDNTIIGDANPNTIIGMAGNDTLTGGAGKDTFVFGPGSGHDVITDYTNVDHIRLGPDYGLNTFAQVSQNLAQVGSNVVLTLSGVDDLTFQNTTLSQFSAANFELPIDTSKFALTFADEFDSLSLYTPLTGQGTWMTQYGFKNATPANSHTLPATGEKEIYVDPSYAGGGATALGLNPFNIEDGVLHISIANTPAEDLDLLYGRAYTSGLLTTQPSSAQTYGYYEIRAELPQGAGAWPAFWLLPKSGLNPPEIDILEAHGSTPNLNVATIHDAALSGGVSGTAVFLPDLSTGFHTYGFLWSPQTLTWYVDGAQVAQIVTPADMNQSMYMLLNLAVDTSAGISSTNLPSALTVDYVHAYATADTIIDNSSLVVPGTTYSDTLVGGAGNDTLTGGAGDDVIDGRGGINTSVYSGSHDGYIVIADPVNGGYWVTDTNTTSGEGRDHIINVQTLAFSDGNFAPAALIQPVGQLITGTAGADILSGGVGNDTIIGGSGNDTIDGGLGTDTASYSGKISDYRFYTNGPATVVVDLRHVDGSDSFRNIETLQFSDKSEVLPIGLGSFIVGSNKADNLQGTSGDDFLTGGSGNDRINGGSGDDVASFSGNRSEYSIYFDVFNKLHVVDLEPKRDGSDTLTGVEHLLFTDQYVDVTTLSHGAGFLW
jgi:beta-glucanase (GH16 family)